jgi:hypothetical protein
MPLRHAHVEERPDIVERSSLRLARHGALVLDPLETVLDPRKYAPALRDRSAGIPGLRAPCARALQRSPEEEPE